ncbi:MAG TPA: transporter [Opitutaceae bacterium]
MSFDSRFGRVSAFGVGTIFDWRRLLWVSVVAAALPVPTRAERELTTDRPDATESPFTVEPGRFQIEASVAAYERDRHNPERDDTRVTMWNVAPVNVRIGLTPASEIQVVVDNYLDVEVEQPSTGRRDRRRGFGDVTLRYKHNLWGNDGGTTALGLMPFVKLPTNTDDLGNNSLEGGVIVPFAAELPAGWGLGAMTEVDVIRDEVDDGYDAVWLNTATVGHDLTERLAGFLELALEVGPGKPALSFNTGLTYAVNADLQLDGGVNLGLTRAAPDLVLFVGCTSRF